MKIQVFCSYLFLDVLKGVLMPRPDQSDSMRALRAATLTELKQAITDLKERAEHEPSIELVNHAKRLESLLSLFIGTLPRSYQYESRPL